MSFIGNGCQDNKATGYGASFGIYASYFIGVFLLFFILDHSGLVDRFSDRLSDCFGKVVSDVSADGGLCRKPVLRYDVSFYEDVGKGTLYFEPIKEFLLFPDGLNLFVIRLPVGGAVSDIFAYALAFVRKGMTHL